MCSKAKAARKAQRDEEAAKEAERDAKIQENIQKNVQLRAKRLAAAADAAGLENEASILISEYGRGLTVGKLRDWAAGHFDQDDRLYPSTLTLGTSVTRSGWPRIWGALRTTCWVLRTS